MSKKIELGLYDDFENERTINIVDINGKDEFNKKLGSLYMKALKTQSVAKAKKYMEEIDALNALKAKFLEK